MRVFESLLIDNSQNTAFEFFKNVVDEILFFECQARFR